MSYYNKSVKDIYKELESSEKGLKNNQISAKIEKFGRNIIQKH